MCLESVNKTAETNSLITLYVFFCRYQFFLQLKQDILAGRLEVPYDVAVELGAYMLQCKCHKQLPFLTSSYIQIY